MGYINGSTLQQDVDIHDDNVDYYFDNLEHAEACGCELDDGFGNYDGDGLIGNVDERL